MKRKNLKIICLIVAVVMIGLATTPVLAVNNRIYDPVGALERTMQSENFVSANDDSISAYSNPASYCPACSGTNIKFWGWTWIEDRCYVKYWQEYTCQNNNCKAYFKVDDGHVWEHDVPGGSGGYCVRCGAYTWAE